MRVVLTVPRDQEASALYVPQVGVTTHAKASWDGKAFRMRARSE